jgi:hypothetical protein
MRIEEIYKNLFGKSRLNEDNDTPETGVKDKTIAAAEPVTGSPDSPTDLDEILPTGNYTSLIFLTGTGKGNTIKSGDFMNLLEINEEMVKSSKEVNFEDFQWICPTDQFNRYLKTTGRNPQDWDTNESEIHEKNSKILDFESYKKSQYLEKENVLSYSDYSEEKNGDILESGGLTGILLPGTTEKGMTYKRKDPGFSEGKLTDKQKKFLKFYYTKNIFLYGSGSKDLKTELNIEDLSNGEILQVFCAYKKPVSGEIDDTTIISFRLKVAQVIKGEGSVTKSIAVCYIDSIVPDIGVEEKSDASIIEGLLEGFEFVSNQIEQLLTSPTGILFTLIGSVTAAWSWGIPAAIAGWTIMANFRNISSGINSLVSAQKTGRAARAARGTREIGIFRRLTGRVGRFVFYPAKVAGRALQVSRLGKSWYGSSRYAAFSRLSSIRGTSKARYVFTGMKAIKLGKNVGTAAKATRFLSNAAKWSNPIGWALLLTDVIVSSYNYTSDNQAPSWDPVMGDDTDALINYSGKNGICKDAKNQVTFKDLEVGKQYTMCWTQGPDSGFGVALSFVASVSTRTTIDMVKLVDWGEGDKVLSVFIVTMVNHKTTWDLMKSADVKLMIFKGAEKYEEGYIDDNISGKFLPITASPKPEETLPVGYLGHVDFLLFADTYSAAKDQMVFVDEKAPEEFTFHFEDSESNVINVWGKKITDADLQNASEEEIVSFFNQEPVSSYIGDPNKETQEEKEQREELEMKVRKSQEQSQKELEKEGSEKEEKIGGETVVQKEEVKESTILSFSDFKSSKLIKEDDGIISQIGDKITKESSDPEENLNNFLNKSTGPVSFAIYFVTLREYADSSLRGTYRPGTFMNFYVEGDVINSSDGADLEGKLGLNNLDILINPKKGLYKFDDSESQRKRTEKEEEEYQKMKGGKSQIEVRSSVKGNVFDLSRTKEKEEEEKENRAEKTKVITSVEGKDVQSLDISSWDDITNAKAIRDDRGNITKIKLKNRNAQIGDKSRELQKGDPGFESALNAYYKYKENKENPTSSPEKVENIALKK